jgi:hypothetical protein
MLKVAIMFVALLNMRSGVWHLQLHSVEGSIRAWTQISTCTVLSSRMYIVLETDMARSRSKPVQKSHCQTQQNQPSLNSFHSHFTVLDMTSKGGFSIIQNKKRKVQLYAQANAQLSAAVHTIRFGKTHFRLHEPQATTPWHVCPKRSKKKEIVS